jgi:hypothetical protein
MNAALAYAKSTMHASHPIASTAEQGLFAPNDPNGKVWVVWLVDDTFQLPACPSGVPQTTLARTCGSGTQARLGLRISDYVVVAAEVYSIPGTPTVQLPITLPPNAKLPTREAAIDAVVHPGGDTSGTPPHVVSADLILAGQESTLGDIAPDTPIWRITLDHGHFDFSCPPQAAKTRPCYSSAMTVWIEAVTAVWRASSYDLTAPLP